MSVKAKQLMHGGVTPHERRVMAMMIGFGQEVPDVPTVCDSKTRILRARLKLEETLEYFTAAGLKLMVYSGGLDDVDVALDEPFPKTAATRPGQMRIAVDPILTPDLAKIADALSDDSVVNTGSFVAHGICVAPLVELTDHNNLMKIANGSLDEHGKFVKNPNHPPPNYHFELSLQGYDRGDDPNLDISEAEEGGEPPAVESPAIPQFIAGTCDDPRVMFAGRATSTVSPRIDAPALSTLPGAKSFEYYPTPDPPCYCPALNTVREARQTPYGLIYSGFLVDAILAANRQFHYGLVVELLGLALHAAGYDKHISIDTESLRVTAAGEPDSRGVVFLHRLLE